MPLNEFRSCCIRENIPGPRVFLLFFDEIAKTARNTLSNHIVRTLPEVIIRYAETFGHAVFVLVKRSCTCRTDCSRTAPGGVRRNGFVDGRAGRTHVFTIVLLPATVDHALWTVIGNVAKSPINCAEGHGRVSVCVCVCSGRGRRRKLTRIYRCADRERKVTQRQKKKKVFRIIDFSVMFSCKAVHHSKSPKRMTERMMFPFFNSKTDAQVERGIEKIKNKIYCSFYLN